MECTRVAKRVSAGREGFTIIELLISTVISVVILGASLSFALAAFRGSEGNTLREEVYRNARFIGMALERDLQTTGVNIASDVGFGTLSTFNDTLVVLHVPWEPEDAYAYTIDPPTGTNNPLDPGGTCGSYCIDFNKDPNEQFDIVPGDIARLQVNGERRVILVTDVKSMGVTVELTFSPISTLLHYESAMSGGLLLDRFATIVQKLQPIVYWVENETLYRSNQLDMSGNLIASPIAWDVKSWDAKMIFVDLDELDEGNPNDGDYTNDFDDILGVRISATLATTRSDIRVAGGELYTRDYEWKFLPRNLMYERNR